MSEEDKPIRQSRWNRKSKVERFTKEQEKDLPQPEPKGWRNGARVRSV